MAAMKSPLIIITDDIASRSREGIGIKGGVRVDLDGVARRW
jgi:hypothetical protein